MTTPSPAHSVVYYVLLFFLLLLHFCHSSDGTIEAMERKDRPFVGWDLRDEMTWIIITATRLMFLLLFFLFLSNRKLVGTNVSPHFLFLSHPHGHPRTSAFFSPADFSILFWLAVSLLTSPTIWAYEFISHQIESPFSPCAGWPVDGWTGRHPAETNGRNGDISRILDCTSKESQKNMESAIYIVFLHHNTIYCDSAVSLHKIHNDTHSILLWMDGWMDG